jgi:hypothetical protein
MENVMIRTQDEILYFIRQEIEKGIRHWIEQAKGLEFAQALESALKENAKYETELRKLRADICLHAHDTVWVGAAETACERITSILGDDWKAE